MSNNPDLSLLNFLWNHHGQQSLDGNRSNFWSLEWSSCKRVLCHFCAVTSSPFALFHSHFDMIYYVFSRILDLISLFLQRDFKICFVDTCFYFIMFLKSFKQKFVYVQLFCVIVAWGRVQNGVFALILWWWVLFSH